MSEFPRNILCYSISMTFNGTLVNKKQIKHLINTEVNQIEFSFQI